MRNACYQEFVARKVILVSDDATLRPDWEKNWATAPVILPNLPQQIEESEKPIFLLFSDEDLRRQVEDSLRKGGKEFESVVFAMRGAYDQLFTVFAESPVIQYTESRLCGRCGKDRRVCKHSYGCYIMRH